MGCFHTVHFFNDRVFRERVVAGLKGEGEDLTLIYQAFMKSHFNGSRYGVEGLTSEEVNQICADVLASIKQQAQMFDASFEYHAAYHGWKNEEERERYLQSADWIYDFSKFFAYMCFIPVQTFSLF